MLFEYGDRLKLTVERETSEESFSGTVTGMEIAFEDGPIVGFGGTPWSDPFVAVLFESVPARVYFMRDGAGEPNVVESFVIPRAVPLRELEKLEARIFRIASRREAILIEFLSRSERTQQETRRA